jgi:methylated-DNA-[protein]-cysteine S-methyltransferase
LIRKEYIILDSPLGKIRAEWNSLGITSLLFDEKAEFITNNRDPLGIREKISDYFEKGKNDLKLPLAPPCTPFQFSVWNEMMKIDAGETVCYEQIARKLGDVKLARAVGMAIGKNPILLAIPCHRVIGKDGALTGYSGGIWRKKWLLQHERSFVQPELFSLV